MRRRRVKPSNGILFLVSCFRSTVPTTSVGWNVFCLGDWNDSVTSLSAGSVALPGSFGVRSKRESPV